MSLTNFIPSVWAASLLENLQKSLVFAQEGVVNRDYEGDIRAFGERVHIHNINPVTIGDYVRDTTTITPQLLTDARRTLLIDQSKYFAFRIDDLDTAQQQPKVMNGASAQAAYDLAEVADRFVAAKYAEAGILQQDTSGTTPTAITLTTANIYSELVRASVTLDEQNVPEEGRFAVIPPWVAGLLLNNDRFVNAKSEAVLNGEIGQVAGLRILKSNNVAVTGSAPAVWHILVGSSIAITYADQITQVEAYRPENSFADALKGLHVYGAKVVRPNALIDLQGRKA